MLVFWGVPFACGQGVGYGFDFVDGFAAVGVLDVYVFAWFFAYELFHEGGHVGDDVAVGVGFELA